jgi:hypothetical protein
MCSVSGYLSMCRTIMYFVLLETTILYMCKIMCLKPINVCVEPIICVISCICDTLCFVANVVVLISNICLVNT